MYLAYGSSEIFESINAAKAHVESLPYYGEAISKGGLMQTIWDADGDVVCFRQIFVDGIGANRTVSVGSWHDY